MTASRTTDHVERQAARSALPPARNRNELWARVLLDELARSGVRELVVAPGSRSAPLVLAAAADGRFRIRVQIDERSGAFLALGVGKATGTPAGVITTSGTAVANLLPAVIEAVHSETPLLLLTADRPPRLRGADANQTIQQVGIFGDAVRLFAELSPAELSERTLRHLRSTACRAVAAAVGDPAGPVHLNLPFEKPLEPVEVPGEVPDELAAGRTAGSGGRPDNAPWTRIHPHRPSPGEDVVDEVVAALEGAERPLLVAGIVGRPWGTGPSVRRAAVALGIPLLADPLSGARYPSDGDATGAYEPALRDPGLAEALRPDLVLRVGAAATSQVLNDWLTGLEGVPHILVDPGGRWKDHAGAATQVVPADPARLLDAVVDRIAGNAESGGSLSPAPGGTETGWTDPGWTEKWAAVTSAAVRAARTETDRPGLEGTAIATVARALSGDDVLLVSSSMPVRDLDTFVPNLDRPVEVYANRGASGIDGIVSTAAGVSVGTGRRVVAVVGDLAAIHDSNGLASLSDPDVNVALVVINNDGGGIFHLLPVREQEPAFTPLVATPHGRDLAHLAAFHELPHRRVDLRASGFEDEGDPAGPEALRDELERALAAGENGAGSRILEIRTDREENRRLREEAMARIVAAAASALD